MIIGKVNFASVVGYFGLDKCIELTGRKVYIADEKTAPACDLILFSMNWFEDVKKLELFCRKTGIRKGNKKNIMLAGGVLPTVCPELIAELVDYVFLGEAESHLKGIIDEIEQTGKTTNPYIYYSGMKIVPEIATEKDLKPFVLENHATKKITVARHAKERIKQHSEMKKYQTNYRIEIARGCKFKCPFCLMSAIKQPYRELPTKDILSLLDGLPDGATVTCFAPERAVHSGWEEIKKKVAEKKMRDFGSDVRLENLDKIEQDSAIIGLEGMSEKLRFSIGKRFTNKFILDKMEMFATTGKRLQWGAKLNAYYIADLPGEAQEDFDEFQEFLATISKLEWSRNLALRPILNPLSPKPLTKMKDAIVHPFRNYPEKWATILRGGNGQSRWGIKIQENKTFQAYERVFDNLVHRGKAKGYQIIKRLPDEMLKKNPADWEKSKTWSMLLIKEQRRLGLTDEIMGLNLTEDFK